MRIHHDVFPFPCPICHQLIVTVDDVWPIAVADITGGDLPDTDSPVIACCSTECQLAYARAVAHFALLLRELDDVTERRN